MTSKTNLNPETYQTKTSPFPQNDLEILVLLLTMSRLQEHAVICSHSTQHDIRQQRFLASPFHREEKEAGVAADKRFLGTFISGLLRFQLLCLRVDSTAMTNTFLLCKKMQLPAASRARSSRSCVGVPTCLVAPSFRRGAPFLL